MLLNLQIQMKLNHSEVLAQAALNFISAGHHVAFLNKSLMQLDNITMPRYLSQPISILLPNVDAPIQNSKWCGQALLPFSYPLFMPRKEPAYRQLYHTLLSQQFSNRRGMYCKPKLTCSKLSEITSKYHL